MRHLALPAAFLLVLCVTLALRPAQRDFASKTSEVLETYSPVAHAQPFEAAVRFLDSLDTARRDECTHSIDCAHRQEWTNVPPGEVEDGVRLGDLDEVQLQRACDLLASVLSQQGYTKVRDILLADDRLLPGGRARRGFGAENYWLGVFGEPTAEGTWALQLDGHHIGVNLTVAGERMGLSPTFIGTQPSSYRRGSDEVVPLRGVVAGGFALAEALSAEQRERAVIADVRGRIAAGAGRDGFVPEPVGLACNELDPAQRRVLLNLVRQYVGDLPRAQADRRVAALRTEIDDMHFAWSGPLTDPSDISYRLQSPSLLIEFACQDLGGDPLDHLHSIYRNPTREYGVE